MINIINMSRCLSRRAWLYTAKSVPLCLFQRAFGSSHAPTPKPSYRPYILGATVAGIGTAFFFAQKEKEYKPNASISSGKYTASYYNPIPPHIVRKIAGTLYKDGCLVPMEDLAYVKVTHYNMQGEICSGELIVHNTIAKRVMSIFLDIFNAQFPIEKMGLDDDENNSSAFRHCPIEGEPTLFLRESLGYTIDINPRLNPYIHEGVVAPEAGDAYANRELSKPGMIQPNDAVVQAFKKRGFTWGGQWPVTYYHRFELDANRRQALDYFE